eukprot:CAMPEP_0202692776 /NCGR_PEP_ID=MMETSP1385-20130828/7080_1 /ASSEMBLY_ACC=CAM_ASM_000861 /TAXON_ID=933848 /ORGANISM="Elphidium margaritaceum" /LENGTH=545 /DNA_ID=CAMNT_0049348371 /DNA_START=84 /DNA_END=1721 /DNA_ORIENTATION=+
MQQDKLNLQHDKLCQKMLNKLGNCFPSPEIVKFSDKVVKINRKGKEQDRVLLLTDKAIYNLMTSDFSKCKRRIDLESIESVTLSTVSLEFVLHIPHEYDYRYKSADKERICSALSMCYSERTQFTKVLVTTYVSQSSLLSVTVTKDASRLKTREERYRRYKELLHYELTHSDEEDVNEMQSAQCMQDDESSKKVLARVNADDFDFLHVIGRGSFGKVMLVKKKDDGEIMAMKVLKKKAIIARKQVQHTKSERLILAQLQQYQHPFLMKLRFAFQTAEKLYFVLDYYRGGELFFHLKKKRRFSESEMRIFVAEVAMALGHLHTLNVIYRDLKPENILLDHAGHVCLTDFGLSKQQAPTEPRLAHTFCGTPEYLAPEIVSNIGHSKAVDWWSLGILAYELSIGIPPFYSQNVNEMYRKIQSAPLQFPPSSSKACRSLISLLLERDQKWRLGSSHDDVREIQRHAFFKNVDWQLLYEKKIEPVYKPNVKHELDVSNFDETFTSEPVAKNSTSVHHNGYNAHHEQDPQFEEFSFVATANDNDDDDDDDD